MWVIVAAAVAMATYTLIAARFGVSQDKSILTTISEQYGRWFAIVIGVSCFLMAASFQFGNNLGVATAINAITGIPEVVCPLLFTALALLLVFFAKNLYKILEKLMMILVMVMIAAFFLNLLFAKPNLISAVGGMIPTVPPNALDEMAALVATTFCLHACLYQAYLVQNKGWKMDDMREGMRDSIAGIVMLGGISMLIIMTSAAALNPAGIRIATAADMAIQLEALFGKSAKYVFSLGLWAAAFSSLTVNAVMGGGLLADGLGIGRTMQEKAPKLFTALIMLAGMTVAEIRILFKGNIVYSLVLAQAATLFAVPSVAIGLFLISNNKKVMQKLANNRWQNVLAVFGLILILTMVVYVYSQLITRLQTL
jgi:Mn2+/Fe2+ NRAMP family transporter